MISYPQPDGSILTSAIYIGSEMERFQACHNTGNHKFQPLGEFSTVGTGTGDVARMEQCVHCRASRSRYGPEAMFEKKIKIEYYRVWGGDSGIWDTATIELSDIDFSIDAEAALYAAVAKLDWDNEGPPAFTGVYHVPDPDPSEEEEDCAEAYD